MEDDWSSGDFTANDKGFSSSDNWSNISPNVGSLGDAKKAHSFYENPLKQGNVEYVDRMTDEFDCPVCQSVMLEPQLTTCGHHFCKGCIEPIYQQAERECPTCKEPGFRIMNDKAIERKIKGLKVHCINRKNGCDWTGERASLEDHLQKRCKLYPVDCKFESFGCKEKVSQEDQDAHISESIVSHMTMVVEQFEAQQKMYESMLCERDTKIGQLERRINDFEATITRELERKSDIKWIPLQPWFEIFIVKDGTPKGIIQRHVPERTVPNGAKEILILIAIHSQSSLPQNATNCIAVFVEEDGVRCSKYIKVHSYQQKAWNDNTDNVWLPMPNNRLVYVDVPVRFSKMFWCDVHLIGYR